MLSAKSGPRSWWGNAAENFDDTSSYPCHSDLQAAGIEHAAVVRDVEERCLCGLWHGLPDSYDLCIDGGLSDAGMFAYPEHGQLFRVLMALGLHGWTGPSMADVLRIMQDVFPFSLIHCEDQLTRILWVETSATCLPNYARLIVRAHCRRQQVRRLWRALHDRVLNPLGEGPRSRPIITHRIRAPRKRTRRFASCR